MSRAVPNTRNGSGDRPRGPGLLGRELAPAVPTVVADTSEAVVCCRTISFRTVSHRDQCLICCAKRKTGELRGQLMGIFDPDLTETIAGVLRLLGSEKVYVVHAPASLTRPSAPGSSSSPAWTS